MAEIIDMPKLGFDMAEGTLVRWVIGEGEKVEKGQVLAEIETDKATVEVESTAGGVLYKHMVEEGAVVPVGKPIAVIAAPGEEVKDLPIAEPAVKSTAPAETKIIEVPKASEEIKIPAAEEPGEEIQTPVPSGDEHIKASPLARRMAAESNLNLAALTGSGPGGRIVRQDIEKAAQMGAGKAQPAVGVALPSAPLPVWQPTGAVQPDQRLTVEKLRAIIGRRMTESKQQIPHFYVTREIDAEPLMTLRRQANDGLAEDQKLSVNDLIVKAAALALRQFPNINATLDGKVIVRHGHVNIGIAVALDAGLMTVVCKDADQKPLRLISQEVKEMASRARQGKVRPEDIEGSTFSISNLGMYDVEDFAAIINPPEAAILAVASVKEVPVVVDGNVKVGLRMKMTISADHRITDGAEAARFMQALAVYLENPVKMVI